MSDDFLTHLFNQDPENLKASMEAYRQKLEQDLEVNPVSTFVPNGAIEKYIRAVGMHNTRDAKGNLTREGRKWIFVIPAGNAVGKSSSTVAILANIIWGPQNEWFDYPAYQKWPHPSKEIWYISEQTTLKEVIFGTDEGQIKEIQKWFPKGRYTQNKFGAEFLSSITTDNGWNITGKTLDMEPRKFESASITIAVFDEPPYKQIFDAVVARLRTGGIILMPMTPLTHAAWVKDELVDKAHEDSDIFVLYADIEQNCIEHGVRGRMPHAQIERLISQYSPEEREARAEGKFGHMQGVVIKGLHPATHRHSYEAHEFTQGHSDKFDTMFRIYCVEDPHELRLPAIAWFALDEYGRTYVVDEFPSVAEWGMYHRIQSAKWTVTDIAEAIKNKETLNGWDPKKIVRVMDPRGAKKRMGETGDTLQQYMVKMGRKMKYPLNFNTNVNTELMAGLALIHEAVRPVKIDEGLEEIYFKVGLNCENVWYHLTHFSQRRREGKALETRGPGDMVEERFKDFVDVVRYYLSFTRRPRRTVESNESELPEHYGLYGMRQRKNESDWRNPHEL